MSYEVKRCRRCDTEKPCAYFEFVVCRVVATQTSHWNIGTSYGWNHSSRYLRIGAGGGYLCRACRRASYWQRLKLGFFAGVLPIMLTIGLAVIRVRFPPQDSSSGLGDFLMVAFLYNVFVGLWAGWLFLQNLGSWRETSEYEIQKLCAPELSIEYKSPNVWHRDELPSQIGGIRLFSPSRYKALMRNK